MNNSSLHILCNTAGYLANNTLLTWMLSFKTVIAVVGIFLFGVLFKVQGTYMAFHPNARLLLISHHVWVVLQVISSIFCNSFSLLRFAMNFDNPCDYLLTAPIAALIKGPTVWAVYGQVWALATMAVERCVATYKYRDYEKSASGIGICLIFIQWLLASLWMFIYLSGYNLGDLKAYPTLSSQGTSDKNSVLLFILAGVEVASFCVFLCLLWYNRRKSARLGNASLTEKYQVNENIRATTLMIPMVVTHFCFFTPSLIALPIYMKFVDPKLDQRYFTVYLETVTLSAYYCVLLPIVLFWRHKVLRQNLQRAFGLNVISPDAPRNQHVRHFELLKDMWRGPA